ncbi:hypothetical protein FACS1894205_0450 [Alphaproteobacteria bacterium]|nr:hypothetical protein FACS1894205_0450 [Alphaproteobacteria bacterium]
MRSLPVAGRWRLSPQIGFDATIGGGFVDSVGGTAPPAASFLGRPLGGGMDVSVSELSFGDSFNTPFHIGIELGYGVNAVSEIALGVRWTHAGAKDVTLAKIQGNGTMGGAVINGAKTVTGRFDDYQDFGVSGLYRRYFMQSGAFHPFFFGVAGLNYTPKIQFSADDPSLGVRDVTFYDSGWIWSVGLGLGFRWDLSRSVSFGLEAGLHYASPLNRRTENDPNAIAGFNRSGERFSLPLTMSALIRF